MSDRPGQLETCCLQRCITRTMLLELLNHVIGIGIAGAKAPREPVPAALGNPLAVREHLELTSLTRCQDGVDAHALLDEGHETRDLDLVVLSSWAVNDFDLHVVLESAQASLARLPGHTLNRTASFSLDRRKMDIQLIANEQDQNRAQCG